MKCKYDNDIVLSFIDGQLADSEKEGFEKHLKACDRCVKKFKVLNYTEKYFRQEVEVEQSLADNVMIDIDENRYKNNTIFEKATLVFYRYKPVWKAALSVTAAIFLAALVFRYSNSIIGIKDSIVASIKQMDNDSEIQKKSKDKIIVPLDTPTQLPTKESDYFIPDITGIKEIMTLNKKQVFKRLGENYTIVNAGAEHAEVGYRYENYGMTIIFGDSKISLIECDEKVSINGAKLGITFSEIKNILGEGETRKLTPIEPEQPYYALFYTYSDIMIWFGAMEENGVATHLQIRRYLGHSLKNTEDIISEESVPSDFYDICIKRAQNQTQIDELNKLSAYRFYAKVM